MKRKPGVLASATTTTGDGGNNRQLVGIGDGGVFLGGKIANVFIVQIDVHERAQLALRRKKMRAHGRMQLNKLLQPFGDGRACYRDSFLLLGKGAERCGNVNLHCLYYLRWWELNGNSRPLLH